MELVKVKVFRDPKSTLPAYKTGGSAGADLFPLLNDGEEITIFPNERKLVKTGLKVAIPSGYEIQIRPRSGNALKQGLTVLNTPGTIDSDYRGDVGIILMNHGAEAITITNKTAIAQMVLARVPQILWEEVDTEDKLPATDRGEGGFGHTGNTVK